MSVRDAARAHIYTASDARMRAMSAIILQRAPKDAKVRRLRALMS